MQEVKIQNLVLNVLTQEQFEGAEKDASQLYLTPDTSIDSSEKGASNGIATLDTNAKVPTEQIPVATTSTLGGVKPDGNTITVTEDGTISATISGEEVATKAELQEQAAEFQQGLSGKADTTLGNVASNIDYVVESQVNANGSWYRKYKSGWLEQGGGFGSNDATDNVVTLLKPYANTAYSIMVGMMIGNDGAQQFRTFSIIEKTISTITIHNGTGGAGNICQWEAKGMGAN